MKILIKNGTLCTMTEQSEPFKGDVLVENGKIVKVDTQIEEKGCKSVRCFRTLCYAGID